MTAYYFSTVLDMPLDDAVKATTEALGRHGFGVLSEIDVKSTLKTKIDVDFRPYRILGACNPKMAYRALQAEDKVGTMLPCNVIVQQLDDGGTEVAAIDPAASMQAIENPELAGIAREVRDALRQVVSELNR